MIINTSVPKSILDDLLAGQTIHAKTDFNNKFSPKAYRLLAKVSNMDNFFFGIAQASEDREDLEIHLTGSNPANDTILTLDIPEDQLFIHDFYGFSGLIYDCEDYDNLLLPDETLLDYAKHLQLIDSTTTVQVIYQELRPEWLIKGQDLKSFDFHDTSESLAAQDAWQKSDLFKKSIQ